MKGLMKFRTIAYGKIKKLKLNSLTLPVKDYKFLIPILKIAFYSQ